MQYGYEFPLQVYARFPVISISTEVAEEAVRVQRIGQTIGKGEAQAIAYCRIEDAIFATNDSAARRFARSLGVAVVSLESLLRAIWTNGIKTRAEVRELLARITTADRLTVSAEVEIEIFGDDEE